MASVSGFALRSLRSVPMWSVRSYKGVNITRIPITSAGMRWQAYVLGQFVYADTLAGIKELVTDTLKGSN